MTDLLDQKKELSTPISSAPLVTPKELLKKITQEQQPVYVVLGLSKKEMEALYVTIHNLYERGKYQEALPLFGLMAFYDHRDKRAWIGMGSCNELLSQHLQAILSYNRALQLDPEDPTLHFRIANCWMVVKKKPQALQALQECLRLCAGKKEYSALREEALHLQTALEHT